MNYYISILLLFISVFSFSQTKSVNKDSVKWEKENIGWEKRIFTEPEFVNKFEITKSSKFMWLQMSMTKECRIFGYQMPDKKSKRLILFSIWTFDVENNPSNCQFGSYYDSSSMEDLELKYIGEKKSFIEAAILKDKKQVAKGYFEKKWVKFVDK